MAPLSTRKTSPQKPHARARQALRDVFLVVAVLALLGAEAFSALHFVLIPHHLCVVHGVLEDGGASADVGGMQGDASHEHADVEVSPQGEDEHEACHLATREEHVAWLERPAAELVAPTGDCVAIATTGAFWALDRAALLSSAPKTSPPARA